MTVGAVVGAITVGAVVVVVIGCQAKIRFVRTGVAGIAQGVGARPAIQSKKLAWLGCAVRINPSARQPVQIILRVETITLLS
jgi:hypothetical protein